VKGDKVVAYVQVRVRLKDSNDWVNGRFADGFEFRNGRIIRYQSFAERPDALAWADIADTRET
jgi:ketosteroid isomerase-like protein